MLKALIFDFDGLILDTEMPFYESWREVFGSFGQELHLAEWVSLVGRGAFIEAHTPCHLLEERLGTNLDHEAIRRTRRIHFSELMERSKPYPGVESLLRRAKESRTPVGLASSSSREWVVGYLDSLQLTSYFDVVRCGTEAGEVKPAPDLYVSVLKGLVVQADEAIALEDSSIGIAAAKAAGVFCVAVPNSVTLHTCLDAADHRVASLDEVSLESLARLLG